MQYIHTTHRQRKLVFHAATIAALSFFVAVPQLLRGQSPVAGWPDRVEQKDYKQLPSKRVNFPAHETVLQKGFDDDSQQQEFGNYYLLDLFPRITSYDPPNRGSANDVIAKLRADLRRCEGRQPQVYDKLAELTVDYMSKIVQDEGGPFHPANRVNAMLAIGEVNSPKAAEYLYNAAFGTGQPVFAFRVAAMAGLVRMAATPNGKKILTNPDIGTKLINKMIGIAGFKKTRTDGITWMRGQAADALSNLGDVGARW